MKRDSNTSLIVFKALPEYNVQDIKSIRERLGMSRKQFSVLLGVSKKTVDAWERGINIPSGTAKRIMQLINDDSEFVVDRLTHSVMENRDAVSR